MKRFGKKWQKNKKKQWWRLQQLQRGGWLVTSQRENNAPFPKPWRPQAEVGVGCWRGLPSAQATQIPVTSIMCGEESGRGVATGRRRRRRQVGWREKGDRRERGVLPVQADRSLSSLPLPSSWTRHGLQTQREHHCYGEIKAPTATPPPKKPGPLLYLPFYYLSPFLLQHAFKLGQNTVPTRGYRFLSGPVSRPRFKEKW